MTSVADTHDPAAKSWVESANAPACPFPVQNLPFGSAVHQGGEPHLVVAIGDRVLDVAAVAAHLPGEPSRYASLRPLMEAGPDAWDAVRVALFELLVDAPGPLRDDAALRARALRPMADVELVMPFEVRSFTDFYASKEHATNVGTMFRGPENALMPNWLHSPIGYNGRASTVVVSGTPVRRPLGQRKGKDEEVPTFGPSRRLDIELELGAVVGWPNPMGEPMTVAQAAERIFGYVLLNDWSARDIQAWEYRPLGPFLGKAFATSISPWVVTRQALAPFRVPTPPREKPLLPYLREDADHNLDLHLEVALKPAGAEAATTVSRTNAKGLYYSMAQQLAHHAIGGCAMCAGDLLGSGTISGAEKGTLGSLLELTWAGKEPLDVGGVTRTFLEDGDTAILRGWAERDGVRIGFGECAGEILPALDPAPFEGGEG
jgi:fumarylacetoacetase